MADRLNDHLENIEDLLRGNEPTPVPPPSPYNQPDALDAHLRLIESLMAEGGIGMGVEIVNELPTTGKKSTIYLVPNHSGKADNAYDKYIWITDEEDEERFESLNKDSFGFKTSWRHDTITNLLTDLNADETVAIGNSYHGEITGMTKTEGLFNGNGELTVNVMNKQVSGNKIMLCIVTSNNVDPYHWEATFIGTNNNTGWIPFIPGTRTIAGIDLKDNITKTELQNALEWDTKQDALDQTQMAAVNSGATSNLIGQITTNQNSITTINSKIPNQATDQNQLADKEFVNSSIATNTAFFIGTFNNITALNNLTALSDNNVIKAGSIIKENSKINDTDYLEDTTLSTDVDIIKTSYIMNGSTIEIGSLINGVTYSQQEILSDIINIIVVTNNDYANVINQELDFNTTTDMNAYDKTLLTNYDYAWVVSGTKYDLYRFDIETQTWGLRATSISKGDVALITAYNRYKYNSSTQVWTWDYTVNTSGFTSVQWAAINSGITADLVGQIGGKADDNRVVHLADNETITGTKTFTANQKLGNAKYLQGLSTNDTPRNLIGVAGGSGNNANTVMVGDNDVDLTLRTTANVKPNTDGTKNLGASDARWQNGYINNIHMTGNITDGTNSINVAGIIAKSTVSVSDTGTATDTVNYITIDGVEKKLSTDNQTIKTSSVTFGANDAVEVAAGSNVTIIGDSVAKTITISATDTTYSDLPAAQGGTTESLVTTGDKYDWNNKAEKTTGDIFTISTNAWITSGNDTYANLDLSTIKTANNNVQLSIPQAWSGSTVASVKANKELIDDAVLFPVIDNGTSVRIYCETKPTADIKIYAEVYD